MATQVVKHNGASYKLSMDDTALHFTSASEAQDSISINLSCIAFVLSAPRKDSETSYSVAYLSQPEGDSATLPAIHTFDFTTRDEATSLTAQPALQSLIIGPPELEPISLIVNPAAGARQASAFTQNVVLPLLKLAGIRATLHETEEEEDAARIAREILENEECPDKVLCVLGGDGTVHEVLNGLLIREGELKGPEGDVEMILIPLGTANALYYHYFPPESTLTPANQPLSTLYSLLAFLRRRSPPAPLSVALNTLPFCASADVDEDEEDDDEQQDKKIITSVVTSSALHACLLHDAEALRSSIPGVERFKVAAHQNASIWWNGRLNINEGAQRYDLSSKMMNGEDGSRRGR